MASIKQKDDYIGYIKSKHEETNRLLLKESEEKKRLEAIIDKQYQEAMELDNLKRKAEVERNVFKSKMQALKTEVESLQKEFEKSEQLRIALKGQMATMKQTNKNLEKKVADLRQPVKRSSRVINEEKKPVPVSKQVQELEEKLNFTVEKFEEQNQKFLQCGRDLVDAHSLIELQALELAEAHKEIKVLKEELSMN